MFITLVSLTCLNLPDELLPIELNMIESLQDIKANGHHFADRIFKLFFSFAEMVYFDSNLCNITYEGPINDKSALVLRMAWNQTGEKPLSETMMT